MIVFAVAFVYLIFCTYTDIRTMRINLRLSAAVCLAGLILFAVSATGHTGVWDFVISISVGISLLCLSLITKGSIGSGDGVMLIVLGCLLPAASTICILLYGLVIAALVSLAFIAAKRYTGKSRLPFAPFLLSGFVAYCTLFLP